MIPTNYQGKKKAQFETKVGKRYIHSILGSNIKRKLPILRQYLSYNIFFPNFTESSPKLNSQISLQMDKWEISTIKIAPHISLKTKAN